MVDQGFHTELYAKLRILRGAQESRCRKYGKEAAEEWLMGCTPTELVEKRAAEIEAMLEAGNASSPDSPPSRDNTDKGKLLSQKQTGRARSRQQPRLATPSPSDVDRNTPASSNQVPVATSRQKRPLSVEPVEPPSEGRAMKMQRVTNRKAALEAPT
jgi:hypothetical protein